MKLIGTINPKKLSAADIKNFRRRKAVRAVVFDDKGDIAILHVRKHDYHKLPGGGIEKDEKILEALKRECLEEIGCRIKVGKKIGVIVEYKDKFNVIQTSPCFLARVAGKKGLPKFTSREKSDGFKLKWMSLDAAIDVLKKDSPTDYHGGFINKRDILYLKEVKKIIKRC